MDERTIDRLLWAAGITMLLGLLFFSLGPSEATPSWASDKLLHGSGYAIVLTCFLLAGVWRPGRGAGRLEGKALLLAAAAVGFSVFVEFLQPLVSRSAQMSDVAANFIGAAFALATVRILRLTTDSRIG